MAFQKNHDDENPESESDFHFPSPELVNHCASTKIRVQSPFLGIFQNPGAVHGDGGSPQRRLGARLGARAGRAAAQTLSGPPGALRGPFFARPRPARPPAGSPGLAPLRGPAAAARRAPGGRGQAVRAGVRAMRGQEIPDRRPRPSAVRHPPRARALHRSRVGQDRAPCACAEIGEHLQNLTDNTCISERRIMTQTMAHLLLLVVSSYSAGLVRYRRFGRPCHVLTLCCTFRRV